MPITVAPPAVNVAVRDLGSSRLSVSTLTPAKMSGDTALSPLVGEIDKSFGTGQAALARSSAAAVALVPLGQVTVTVIGGGVVVEPVVGPDPPPPQA